MVGPHEGAGGPGTVFVYSGRGSQWAGMGQRLLADEPAFAAAMTDGEDFELLFTVAAKSAVKLLDAWKKQFPKLKLSCIGKIVAGDGILIRDKSGAHKLNAHGYVHFA